MYNCSKQQYLSKTIRIVKGDAYLCIILVGLFKSVQRLKYVLRIYCIAEKIE